ncbi:hypothetical protein FIBSPDRAFT_865232, partial [Athelia psychrophila]
MVFNVMGSHSVCVRDLEGIDRDCRYDTLGGVVLIGESTSAPEKCERSHKPWS